MKPLRVPLGELAGFVIPKETSDPATDLARVVCPSGKRAYSKAEAKQAARGFNTGNHEGHTSGLMIVVFRCGFCPYYHIGHNRRGRV